MRGIITMLVVFLFAAPAGAADMSELATIKWQMIQQSALIYKDKETNVARRNCPCPYNIKIDNNSCGKGSAWCLKDGLTPLCYADEISDADARRFASEPRWEQLPPEVVGPMGVKPLAIPQDFTCGKKSDKAPALTSSLNF